MIRKVVLVLALMAATCFAGLVLEGSSLVPTSNAMDVGQNDNRYRDRDRDRGNSMNRRRHRRHYRRWMRRHRRHDRRNRNRNDNRQ